MSHQYNKKHKRRSCENKIRYNSRNGSHIAFHVLKRKKLIFHEMKAYHCNYCNGWHIGRINEFDDKSFKKLERIIEQNDN